ncbi:MAG: DUF6502 family protein [Xanthomonadales bacterium]|jgi:hypothetical protein|nr:DUF6502 family protein [Xanthomonadales bacterium]
MDRSNLLEKLTPYVEQPQQLSDTLINAAIRLLRGFMRLFIGRITFDVLVEIMRRIAVEEGCRRVAAENNGKVILSRVAMLTGVRMQQVKELMNEPFSCDESDLTLESRILNRWANDPSYRDPSTNEPIDLLVLGSGRTFQRLVTSVAGRGVTTQTALDRLLENGHVEIINNHWVRLLNPYWTIIKGTDCEMLDVGSFSIENQINTIIHNIEATSSDQRWVQRFSWSVALPQEKIQDLRTDLADALKNYHEDCKRIIRNHEDTSQPEFNTVLVGAGLYYWQRQPNESLNGLYIDIEHHPKIKLDLFNQKRD